MQKLTYLLFAALFILSVNAFSQQGVLRGASNRFKQLGSSFSKNSGGGQGGQDSLKRRDKLEDSITIRYHYLDSTSNYKLDSSVEDFTSRFPLPATNVHLGNMGTASHSLLFSPIMQAGWDPGFHVFDIYKWKMDRVRFFNTTRPYSEINYLLASRAEQLIQLTHTQNIKPNWNFLLQYRLINAPGFFKNQKTNHNNYLFTTWYQTVNKRYNAYVVLLGNKLESGENGGVQDPSLLKEPGYEERFNLPTKIGGDADFGTNFFNPDVGNGNRYKDFSILIRQQYDFGRKDSLVTDSTVIPLFYPRLRFEYTFEHSKKRYQFRDFVGDSTYYKDNYGIQLALPVDTVILLDQWKEMTNDFSIYTYPDAKNLQQFFKVGAAIQNISLENIKGNRKYYNIFGHAEYRNRTRNQKWNILANGNLYFVGLNAGDYQAAINLQRSVGKRQGYIQLGFENVNRTPSFNYNGSSAFNLMPAPADFKKENIAHASASLFQPFLKLTLEGHYYLVTNYAYITDYYQLQQETTLFNVLQISAHETLRLAKHWFLHTDIYFQKLIGSAPLNLPIVYTRNRIGYEGKLGFKNLDIAFGAEVRYHPPYKADNYSPVLGSFFYQNTEKIDNPMPDIRGYLNFRIRSFKFFLNAENLNSARLGNGFSFTNNNMEVPNYPYPGLIIRLGVYWGFVN